MITFCLCISFSQCRLDWHSKDMLIIIPVSMFLIMSQASYNSSDCRLKHKFHFPSQSKGHSHKRQTRLHTSQDTERVKESGTLLIICAWHWELIPIKFSFSEVGHGNIAVVALLKNHHKFQLLAVLLMCLIMDETPALLFCSLNSTVPYRFLDSSWASSVALYK